MELMIKFFEYEHRSGTTPFKAPLRGEIMKKRLKQEKKMHQTMNRNVKDLIGDPQYDNLEDLFEQIILDDNSKDRFQIFM